MLLHGLVKFASGIYRFVFTGGKVFLLIATVLITIAALLRLATKA